MRAWQSCGEPQCSGERLAGEHCLAHLSDCERDSVIDRLQSGQPLNARGVRFTASLLRDLLRGLGADDGQARIPLAHFNKSEFIDTAHFENVEFLGHAHFDGAHFMGDAHFDGAQFSAEADFRDAWFSKEADFRKARFVGPGRFRRAQFDGEARFRKATFSKDCDIRMARFGDRTSLALVVVAGTLLLDRTSFERDVQLELAARAFSCVRTQFRGRADLNVLGADVALDRATFVASSRLGGVGSLADLDEELVRPSLGDRFPAAPEQPRLLSIRHAVVENLALRNVDLRACRFQGAHGLDQLHIEVDCRFGESPASWRYTRRRILAEEHDLRWPRDERAEARATALPGWLAQREPVATLEHGEVASIYRSLRKAFEDHKDEPGAADFYYGEMEMRRLTRRGPSAAPSLRNRLAMWSERATLWLYWLVSGYGLRASRALFALLMTVLLFAVTFDLWGFDGQPFWRTLLFSAQSTTSLFKAPDKPQPEPVGEALQLALRLLGPLFFGLALLSLRGRVKR